MVLARSTEVSQFLVKVLNLSVGPVADAMMMTMIGDGASSDTSIGQNSWIDSAENPVVLLY